MRLTPTIVANRRALFPALARRWQDAPVVYFDGPAGTQTPRTVIDAIGHYLANSNANSGGLFAASRETDALLDRARRGFADFVGAADPDEIAFGANMTSLTFALSRALARAWRPGDEVVVTRLDHDANVTPWVLAARDAGAVVRAVGVRREDGALDLEDLRRQLSPRTRLVAVGCASNATGGINPVREITALARAVGARVFLDAVHYAPHALIDVAGWGCDFLVCSAYKFFGPHLGVMWGKRQLLEDLEAYKLRPAPNTLPGKWMTGTQSFELIAGGLAAVDYLADLGREAAGDPSLPRRAALAAAFAAIGAYEHEGAGRLLAGLQALGEVKIWGVADPARLAERVATFSFTHARKTPEQLAFYLAEHGVFAWHGNYYALPFTEAMGLEPRGMLRVGYVHYNTPEEIDRFLALLAQA